MTEEIIKFLGALPLPLALAAIICYSLYRFIIIVRTILKLKWGTPEDRRLAEESRSASELHAAIVNDLNPRMERIANSLDALNSTLQRVFGTLGPQITNIANDVNAINARLPR